MYPDKLQHGHGAPYQGLDRELKEIRYHIDDAPRVGRCTSPVRCSPPGATRCTRSADVVSQEALTRTPCSRRWEGFAWHVGQQGLTMGGTRCIQSGGPHASGSSKDMSELTAPVVRQLQSHSVRGPGKLVICSPDVTRKNTCE